MKLDKIFTNTGNSMLNKLILKSLPIFLTAVFCLGLMPNKNFALSLNFSVSPKEISTGNGDFDKKFREGRDLIDKEEWSKAAEKFKGIIDKYPEEKSVDAALYWLAFCYKKQKLFKETDATNDRHLEKFPASAWANDAKVMKMEIAAPLGKWIRGSASVASSAVLPVGVYKTIPPDNGTTIIAPAALEGYTAFDEFYNDSKTPIDREDEIRIAAFQSLLSADVKRGIEAMSGILKPDSKASETLKIEVIRAVRRPRITGNYAAGILTTASPVNSLNKESNYLFREVLAKSFKNEKSTKVRKEIIYTLANLRDEQSADYLAQLYSSENDREIKRAIINGLGSIGGINGFSIARFSEESSSQNPKTVVSDKQAKGAEFVKLLEIVRTENDSELRALALTNLQRFEGWSSGEQTIETLVRIYDSEATEDFKKTLIQSFGKMKQKQALEKLFDIAENDKSDKLRLEAIYALRNSNQPEALKFLEDLIN